MWPLIVGGALAAGGAIGNYLSNEADAERLTEAYDKLTGRLDSTVNQNQSDIDKYGALMSSMYGGSDLAYKDALKRFTESPVYQNQDFSYDDDVSKYYDPYANQRMDAAMRAIENSAAANGNRFSSDFIDRVGAKQQAMASEEWEKAYDKLMKDRQMALQEYNANSQNGWNNYNAQQKRLTDLIGAYGNDRSSYAEGMGDVLSAGMNNRMGALQTQAQTIMGKADAQQGTGIEALLGNLSSAGANFFGNYFGN